MKHQRARNGQFDKRWQPVEKTKDYQLLEGAWGEAAAAGSQEVIAVSQRNEMMAGQSIQRGSWFVYRTRPAKLSIGRPVWNIFPKLEDIGRYCEERYFFEYFPALENIGRYCEEAAEHTFELGISLQTSRLECNTTSTPTIKLKETL